MKIPALILLMSFVVMAVFGLFLMQLQMNNHGGCLASAMDDSDCPLNMFDFVVHHLVVFASFSLGVFSSLPMVLLIVLSVSLIAFCLVKTVSPPNRYFRLRFAYNNPPIPKQPFLNWLSLFEHSPSFSL